MAALTSGILEIDEAALCVRLIQDIGSPIPLLFPYGSYMAEDSSGALIIYPVNGPALRDGTRIEELGGGQYGVEDLHAFDYRSHLDPPDSCWPSMNEPRMIWEISRLDGIAISE